MARYNISFSVEKEGKTESKFEVVECESNNREYVIRVIHKKYPDYSITIKRISESINGKAMSL